MTFVFCDDNKIFLEFFMNNIQNILKNMDKKARLIAYNRGADLIEYMKSGQLHSSDAVLLDLEMPEFSGFDIASFINSIPDKPAIIFVSNMDDMVYESFAYQPFWFLRKSDMGKLPELIEKLAVRAETRDHTYAFKQDGVNYSLPLSDIIYFESRNHELNIYTAEKTYIQRQTIANAAAATEPYFFVRCHASFLVNCKHITAVKKGVVTLDNSIDIPASRNKQKETEAAYMNYLRNTVQTI